jgi:hypothetical protein
MLPHRHHCATIAKGSPMKTMSLRGASLLIALAGLFVGGCKNDNGPDDTVAPVGVTNEEQAMSYFAQNDDFVTNDEITFADASIQPFDYGTFGKVDASITPIRWGRFVTGITRTVTTVVQPGDTTAIAHVNKVIVGTLKIRALAASGDSVTIEKPYTNQADRNLIFKRVSRDTKKFWLNWVPVASSLVAGGTAAPGNTVGITTLVLYGANNDAITITDPEQYFLRYRWLKLFNGGRSDVPEFVGGQAVKLEVTVVSSSADTDLVALRYGFAAGSMRRAKLALTLEVNNGDGTYTRVFAVSKAAPLYMHFSTGAFNMGVEAMSKASLFDDQAPYSVSWWGIPYRVF